jgi:hypothetical protein
MTWNLRIRIIRWRLRTIMKMMEKGMAKVRGRLMVMQINKIRLREL